MDAVRHIVQSLRESARAAERHAGVSGAQLFVLHVLADSEPMTMNDLAARTHTHQSSVSTVVAALVERGLVKRVPSVDRRQRRLSLSAAGRKLIARAPDAAQARLVLAIRRFQPARRRALATALTDLARAVDSVERVPAMFFEDRSGRLVRRVTRRRRG